MRALKILVVVMGLLIIAGFGVLVTELALRVADPTRADRRDAPAAAAEDMTLALPEGARIETLTASGNRLVVHARLPDGQDEIYVVDLARGEIIGTLTVTGPSGEVSDAPAADQPAGLAAPQQ